jgi:hypothetical protein
VHSPDFPVGEGESGHTDMQQGCSVRHQCGPSGLSEVCANAQRLPLRCPLLDQCPAKSRISRALWGSGTR